MILNTIAIAWKELQVLFKDKGALALTFLLPLLIGGIMGGSNMVVGGDDENSSILLEISLVNEDKGVFGKNVAEAIETINELDVTRLEDTAVAETQVAEGNYAAAIIIPSDFTANINAYTPTTIDVILDPAQPESARIITGIMNQVVDEVTIWGEVQYGIQTVMEESGLLTDGNAAQQKAVSAQSLGVIMTTLNDIRETPMIAVISESLDGAVEEDWRRIYFALLFPGFTVMFIFLNVTMSASSLLGERETGTLRRLLAAPLPRGTVIAGKMLAYMSIACLQVLIMFAVANLLFDMPLGQSPLGLIVLSLIVAFTSAAMGMMIAALAKSASQASTVGVILGIALGAIGGGINMSGTPLFRMDGFIAFVSKLTPHAHAVEGYFSLMGENATFVQIMPEMGILLAYAVVFFLIARWRFKY